MSTPVGPNIGQDHDTPHECFIQVVLVVDAQEDKRVYRWDCYDLKGNMLERVGYKHGMIEKADGSMIKGDTVLPFSPANRAKLKGYLEEIGVENVSN